jgi:mannose-6-phosphate isomerase-like protein (cupin superfamily)
MSTLSTNTLLLHTPFRCSQFRTISKQDNVQNEYIALLDNTMASLPPARLVTTSHTANGTSVIASDVQLTPFHPFGPTATGFTVLHSTPSIPASNTTSPYSVPTTTIPRPSPSGAVFCTSDFPPHYSAPMHRTLSLDYCVVLSGSIWIQLDGGEEMEVKTGEMVVQRGTNHLWM